MEYLKANGSSDGAEESSLAIYRKTVGMPKKCRVVGWVGGNNINIMNWFFSLLLTFELE